MNEAGKPIFSDLKKEDREAALRESSKIQDVQPIRRHYSDDEKWQMKDFLSVEAIKQMEQEEEFAEIAKTFRKAIKEHKDACKGVLKDIKRGFSENSEPVFGFDDQENGVMHIYDKNGEFLTSRKLYPEERQTKILDFQKEGTND